MQNEIIEYLGLTYLPRAEQETILTKISEDHLILSRAQALALNPHIVEAVRELHALELQALKKRIGAIAVDPVPTPFHWAIQIQSNGSEIPSVIIANCDRCRQSARWVFPFAQLLPKQIQHAVDSLSTWHGCTRKNEHAPEEIKARWREMLEGLPRPVMP